MGRVAVGIGDVFAFTAARRWVPCQIIGTLQSYWQVIVFDALSTKRPRASIVDGAPIYVLRHTRPKNEPLYLACPGDPPVGFTRLGRRPVALAFPLPTTFRTSPRAGDDSLPVHAEWSYARDQVKDDRSAQPPPFHSKLFPTWRVVDPRALRDRRCGRAIRRHQAGDRGRSTPVCRCHEQARGRDPHARGGGAVRQARRDRHAQQARRRPSGRRDRRVPRLVTPAARRRGRSFEPISEP